MEERSVQHRYAGGIWHLCATVEELRGILASKSIAGDEFDAWQAEFGPAPIPAAAIWKLATHQNQTRKGYGRAALKEMIENVRGAGARIIFLKVGYAPTNDWERERGWKERFYVSEGFTVNTDPIRPLMHLYL